MAENELERGGFKKKGFALQLLHEDEVSREANHFRHLVLSCQG